MIDADEAERENDPIQRTGNEKALVGYWTADNELLIVGSSQSVALVARELQTLSEETSIASEPRQRRFEIAEGTGPRAVVFGIQTMEDARLQYGPPVQQITVWDRVLDRGCMLAIAVAAIVLLIGLIAIGRWIVGP